ncbi:MAG: hypothetical protein WCY21_03400 [Candidatus Cloacimonadaceae bacterium]|jgi:hypothetical protein|nr:hypothetical protein [Candidatus Cloacimonadota bacterium]MDX9949393.1 hypothetical protein [Candidatus Syntrophosphaera sp.]NLN84639.1 hypothetical protein [Candidatus Cloacimonadota bacterium]
MKIKTLVFLGLLCFLLFSCAPGVSDRSAENRAGFFMGIWHGWIAPITLIWQFFNREVRIYEYFNTGWLYDLGYYLGVAGGFGSVSFTRRRSCKRD